MAFYIMLLLSLGAGVGATLAADAFGGLAWLWVLPLSCIGAFLGWLILLALVIFIMAWCVDMEKPQEKDSKFYRWVLHMAIQIVFPTIRWRVHTRGLELAPKCKRVMLVCNHINDIDPGVLMRYFPQYELAFISKRENEKKPVIGPFLRKLMCQSVNRENDREALKTILNCIRLLKEDVVSIGVFPEGYVSRDHKLQPFRSGVFKVAQKAQVPIVVCTLQNTYHALPNLLRMKATDMQLHLVGVIQPEDYAGMSTIDLGNRIYKMMDEDLNPGG